MRVLSWYAKHGLQHPQHFGDQQILLKYRGIQVTQAALIGFSQGANLGG
jgi:predicted esterase